MQAKPRANITPLRWLKYTAGLTVPLATVGSFFGHGIWCFTAVVYAFAFIPFLESLLGSNGRNLESAEAEVVAKDRIYDLLLYFMVPMQWAFVVWFVVLLQDPQWTGVERLGKTLSLGMLCGVLGINVAHELGHRPRKFDRICARLLLLSSLYLHFFIEHNQGHHKNVATPNDPASARLGETLYFFWLRSIITGYRSAWRIQNQERKRKQYSWWSIRNEMWWFQIAQLALVSCIGVYGGWITALCFTGGATVGFLLLETVNYIEHYGLSRKKVGAHRYADVTPVHSWNSNHVVGRMVLFELTRHSDHHHMPQKPYQLLDTIENAPQLPAGYPTMILLSLVPPAWFRVMNKRAQAENVRA